MLDGSPTSVDVAWFDLASKAKTEPYYFTNSKMEDVAVYNKAIAASKGTKQKMNKIISVESMLDSIKQQRIADEYLFPAPMPMPKYLKVNGNKYDGKGQELKFWMLGDLGKLDAQIPPQSNSGGNSGGTSGGSSGGSSSGGSSSSGSGSSGTTTTNKKSTKSKSTKTSNSVVSTINKYCQAAKDSYSKSIMQNEYFYTNLNNWRTHYINYVSDERYKHKSINDSEYDTLISKVDTTYNEIKSKYAPKKKKTASIKGNSLLADIGTIIQNAFTPLTVYASEVNGDKPEDENAYKDKSAYGLFLINTEIEGKYVFELDNVGAGKKYDTPLKACSGEGYILLAEPLYAFIPKDYTSKKNFSGGYVIGTATSFSQGMCLLRDKGLWTWKSGSSDMNSRVSNRTAPRAMYIPAEFGGENTGYDFKIVVPTDNNLPTWGNPASEAAIPFEYMKNFNKLSNDDYIGFGLHIYTFGNQTPEDMISTWDRLNYPDTEGPSEDPTDKKDGEDYKEKGNTFKVVKYYQMKYPPTDDIEPMSYFVAVENPHRVQIDDEVKGNNYKLKDWFTSTTDWTPPENGEPTDYSYSDSKKQYNNGKYKGTQESLLEVKPEDKEVVLHILLEYEPEYTGQKVETIKIYETDGVTDRVSPKEEVTITNNIFEAAQNEEGYIFKEATTSPEVVSDLPASWTEVPQENLTTSKEVPIAEDTNTIYIHYIRVTIPPSGGDTAITLHENELSFPFSIAGIGSNYKPIKYTFPNKSDSGSEWHHYPHGKDESCNGWNCSWHTQINDGTYLIEVANTMDYNATSNIGAQGDFAGAETGKVSTSNSEVSAVIGGFDTTDLTPNWQFVAYRDKTKDLVTLYPHVNDPMNKNMVGLIGIHNESSIPAGSRIAKEGGDKFTGSFKTNYVYTASTDKGLSWNSTGCSQGHGTSGDYSGVESIGISNFNNLFSGSNIVTTKYYLGKANKGEKEVSTSIAIPKILDKEYKTHMSGFLNNSNYANLYPYIQMQYRVLDGTGSTVYVTSENLSKIKIANKVEVGMYREGNGPNLQLDSTQWSTHAKSLEGLQDNGVSDKYSILPGGAASTLTTGKGGVKTHLGIKTYQTVVEDNIKELLAPESSILTVSEANTQYEAFKSQTKDVLEHYQIVQWVGKGMDADLMEFWERTDTEIVSGPAGSGSFAGQNLSTDSKYYLKTDGNGADRADLDIIGEKSRKTTWKIASDTQGNVVVTKDNVEIGKISQAQAVTQLLANLEIKELNDKTKIIENYILAIDRNQGNDRDGNKWYNEAFGGITVIINEWDIELGFGGNTPTRGSILDTKLCGVQTDRRDTYNFKPETINDKVRTSMFAVSSQSTSAQAAGKPEGYLGNLGDMVVGINGVQNIFNSKLFYIPNATVTDLN